jgi:hypothetical protein
MAYESSNKYPNSMFEFVEKSSLSKLQKLLRKNVGNIQELQEVMVMLKEADPSVYEGRIFFVGLLGGIQFFESFIRKNEKKVDFDFYKHLYPSIVKYALEFDKYCKHWPLMMKQVEQTVTLKSNEIRFMLANAFFLNVQTLSTRANKKSGGGGIKSLRYDYGDCSFGTVFTSRAPEACQRVATLLAYFYLQNESDQLSSNTNNNNNNSNSNSGN